MENRLSTHAAEARASNPVEQRIAPRCACGFAMHVD
jgi:hypothetical protein